MFTTVLFCQSGKTKAELKNELKWRLIIAKMEVIYTGSCPLTEIEQRTITCPSKFLSRNTLLHPENEDQDERMILSFTLFNYSQKLLYN